MYECRREERSLLIELVLDEIRSGGSIHRPADVRHLSTTPLGHTCRNCDTGTYIVTTPTGPEQCGYRASLQFPGMVQSAERPIGRCQEGQRGIGAR